MPVTIVTLAMKLSLSYSHTNYSYCNNLLLLHITVSHQSIDQLSYNPNSVQSLLDFSNCSFSIELTVLLGLVQ